MFKLAFLLYTTALLAQSPHLVVSQPNGPLLDQKVEIRIEGLSPFQKAKLTAQMWEGDVWYSGAEFQADERGVIDVSTTKPLEGSSYSAVDPRGLFWSMDRKVSSYKCKRDEWEVELSLFVDECLVDSKQIPQVLKAHEVETREVRENGLVGTLFIPQSDHPLPVIITLSGSNGGLSTNRAKLLASNGFAVLALGYFGMERLPPQLKDIPLEYFEKTFAWLETQPEVNASQLGLYGVSRGGELALILGSVFPEKIGSIVAVVPSSVVYGGLGDEPTNAWVYAGKPLLPIAPVPRTEGAGTRKDPINTRRSFIAGMEDRDAFIAAAIPVEKIQCPILLISGGDDQMWPSEIYANQIKERLLNKGSQIQVTHLHYPKAGHGIGIPNIPMAEPLYFHPVSKLWFTMGGSREADARASLDSWQKLVAFFHDTFNSYRNMNLSFIP